MRNRLVSSCPYGSKMLLLSFLSTPLTRTHSIRFFVSFVRNLRHLSRAPKRHGRSERLESSSRDSVHLYVVRRRIRKCVSVTSEAKRWSLSARAQNTYTYTHAHTLTHVQTRNEPRECQASTIPISSARTAKGEALPEG